MGRAHMFVRQGRTEKVVKRCWRWKKILHTVLVLQVIVLMSREALGRDVTSLSLEELMEIEVTSAAKRAQKLEETPAAVFVITREDIRRSGATTIADLLRMVPGVHVARANSESYALSVRGFSEQYANKLLVLMDGRTVYSPIFSGVFWERVDDILEDIERIEVIRGPGASLWGANAVNGIINIITRKAADTQGLYSSLALGTEDREILSLRYGDKLGDGAAYRVYVKARERDESVNAMGRDDLDDWRQVQGGFRMDWKATETDTITLRGDVQHRKGSRLAMTMAPTFTQVSCHQCHVTDWKNDGASFLGRWRREDGGGNAVQVQAYYDHQESTGSSALDWRTQVFDLEYQQDHAWGERQHWTWGTGFRLYRTDTMGSFSYSFWPEDSEWTIWNAFVQDEIALVKDKLILTLGTKFEYQEETDLAIQPTGRLLWKVNNRNSLWAAASRAVRTPCRGEWDARLRTIVPGQAPPPAAFLLFALDGSKDLESEEVVAYEIGYRSRISDRFTVDAALFYNRYDKLIVGPEPTSFSFSSGPPLYLEARAQVANAMDGEVYGFEVEANWDVTRWWKLRGAYTLTQIFLHNTGDVPLRVWGEETEGKFPAHMFSLRSQWNLSDNVDLDVWLRYVDSLPSLGVPSYVTTDVRLAWRPHRNLELSLVGQNLLDSRHSEWGQQQTILPGSANQVERALLGQISWSF